MSAKEFAEAIELKGSIQNVYAWELGRSDVPDKYYEPMMGLGINPTWILTGHGQMFIDDPKTGHAPELGEKEPVPSVENATVVGRVMAEKDQSVGHAHLWDLMNVVGVELKRHSTQLNDHESRLVHLESIVEELSTN